MGELINENLWKTILLETFFTVVTIVRGVRSVPKYIEGKSTNTSPRHFPLPPGSFVIWQLDSISCPSLKDINNHILVMICMCFHWLESFPYKQAALSCSGQRTVGKDCPYLRIPWN